LAAVQRLGIACISLGATGARLAAPGSGREPVAPDPNPTIDILTSGTTGAPKQFPIGHHVFAHMMLNQGAPVRSRSRTPEGVAGPASQGSDPSPSCATSLRPEPRRHRERCR